MTSKAKQATPDQVVAVLRQRMKNELRFEAGAHTMSITRDPADNPFGVVSSNSNSYNHTHPEPTHRSTRIFQGELEILLDHVESLERQINAHPPMEIDPDA